MGYLTTHVLDTAHGRPARGMKLEIWRLNGDSWMKLKNAVTNADGRLDAHAVAAEDFDCGTYELRFQVADYFAAQGTDKPANPFLDEVPIRFGVSDKEAHYHVPLLVSPYSYSTYRGS